METPQGLTRPILMNWLKTEIQAQTGQPVDEHQAFSALGLDSVAAVALSGDLEERFGLELDPTVMFEYPTLTALLDYLQAEGLIQNPPVF
jgi:acyl carrier protein